MSQREPFVDIHCHLLPGIDDGAADWDESLAMARMAVADGIGTVIVTPHQLGNYASNSGQTVRDLTAELQHKLNEQQIPLRVMPGADVRIEPDLPARLARGEVVSLADTGRYVLLELPHEMYMPLDHLLANLATAGYVGILSHPERNRGIQSEPTLVAALVKRGCLMQVTAGSLLGAFGRAAQRCSETWLGQGLIHFVATDAHGMKSRMPQLRPAYERIESLHGRELANQLCCVNPAKVVNSQPISVRRAKSPAPMSVGWSLWGAAK